MKNRKKTGKILLSPTIKGKAFVNRYLGFISAIILLSSSGASAITETDKGSEDLHKLLFTETEFDLPSDKTSVYIGQSLPLRITVYAADDLSLKSLSYPRLQTDDITFKDFSRINRENHRFAKPEISSRSVDEANFTVVDFRTRITPLTTGKLNGDGSLQAEWIALESDGRTSKDDDSPDNRQSFVSEFFGRATKRIEHELNFDLPPLEVEPLPPPPPEAENFLGLVGNWQLKASFNPEQVRRGKPSTLKISMRGEGDPNMLKTPELDIPDFREFEPEKEIQEKSASSRINLSWVIIPLSGNTSFPPLHLSTFNPETGRYEVHTLYPQLTVKASEESRSVNAAKDDNEETSGQTAEKKAAERVVRFIKTKPAPYLKRPLWRNNALQLAFTTLSACIIFVTAQILTARRKRRQTMRSYRQRSQNVNRLLAVIQEVSEAPESEKNAIVRESLVPCLIDCLELPHGTTMTGLAQEIETKDTELADILRSIEIDAFLPGKESTWRGEDLRQRVLSLLQQGMRVMLLGFIVFAFTEHDNTAAASMKPESVEESALGDNFKEAVRRFKKGDFQQAETMFENLGKSDSMNPVLLFNRGNCAFEMEDFLEAAVFYEQALKLSPRDTDIRQNLNTARRQLGLSPIRFNKADTLPVSFRSIRDQLRPDEWLTVAAAVLILTLLTSSVVVWKQKRWLPLFIAGLLLTAVPAWVSYSQFKNSYAPDTHALIADEETAPRRYPHNTAEAASSTVKTGQRVRIRREITGWYKVENKEEQQFWLPRQALKKVW